MLLNYQGIINFYKFYLVNYIFYYKKKYRGLVHPYSQCELYVKKRCIASSTCAFKRDLYH